VGDKATVGAEVRCWTLESKFSLVSRLAWFACLCKYVEQLTLARVVSTLEYLKELPPHNVLKTQPFPAIIGHLVMTYCCWMGRDGSRMRMLQRTQANWSLLWGSVPRAACLAAVRPGWDLTAWYPKSACEWFCRIFCWRIDLGGDREHNRQGDWIANERTN
jgi:hypothetical protein